MTGGNGPDVAMTFSQTLGRQQSFEQDDSDMLALEEFGEVTGQCGTVAGAPGQVFLRDHVVLKRKGRA